MRLHIIAATLFALFVSSPAIAEEDYTTIGGMRSACKTFLDGGYDKVSLVEQGICLGWIVSEKVTRICACVTLETSPQALFAGLLARDFSGHSAGAQIQGYVNWADANPQLWSETLTYALYNKDLWAEFPC